MNLEALIKANAALLTWLGVLFLACLAAILGTLASTGEVSVPLVVGSIWVLGAEAGRLLQWCRHQYSDRLDWTPGRRHHHRWPDRT